MVPNKTKRSTISVISKNKLAEIVKAQNQIACNVRVASYLLNKLNKKSLGLLRKSKGHPLKSCSVNLTNKRQPKGGYYPIDTSVYNKVISFIKPRKRRKGVKSPKTKSSSPTTSSGEASGSKSKAPRRVDFVTLSQPGPSKAPIPRNTATPGEKIFDKAVEVIEAKALRGDRFNPPDRPWSPNPFEPYIKAKPKPKPK
jgi:hypothetical protein